MEICSRARLIRLRRNTAFLLNNDPVSKVFFLGSGTAKLVSLSTSGADMVTEILVDNEIFGDFSFNGYKANAYVAGLKPNTYLFYFASEDLKKLLHKNHTLALNFSEAVSNKLRHLEARHSVWTNKDARLRLLYFFQGWASCTGIRTLNSVILENYFALNDIAEFIGVSRQFLYVMLKELRREGFVKYSRKQIEIANDFLEQNTVTEKQVI